MKHEQERACTREHKKRYSLKHILGFIIPSAIGVILFMIPINSFGQWTVAVKIISDALGSTMGAYLPFVCVGVITVSALGALIAAPKPQFFTRHKTLFRIFYTTPVWIVVRCVGAVFAWIAVLHLGSGGVDDPLWFLSMISDDKTGGFVLNNLLCVLVIIFLFAGILLPLLLDFGLLEFIGALCTKVMRPLFKIPGRAAVDCITSWIGDGTLGVMLTCNQYEGGYYSAREAAVIATTFSAVSITFSIVVLTQVGLMEYFGVYYLLICLVGVVCAIIVPRIPPLSLKKDDYLVEGKAMEEDLPEGYKHSAQYGLDLAIERVKEQKGILEFINNGLENATGMWFGVMPVVMCIGTLALVFSQYTNVFEIMGIPFTPLLNFLQVPESAEVSKTMIVGFVDMFTPSVIAASDIASPMSRFIVAVVSVTQLIYLSEVGGVILGSKIPVNILELFILFLERTVISLLIVAPIAHLLF